MTEREFWQRVEKTPFGCWTWKGYTRSGHSYGRLRVGTQVVYAHRYSFELEYGPIPPGLHVLHDCDNPPCVNPRHLWLGTNADNQHDKVAKGRQAHIGKLTKDVIPAIFAARAEGKSASEIAAMFGVAKRTIYHVLAGNTWRPFGALRKQAAA